MFSAVSVWESTKRQKKTWHLCTFSARWTTASITNLKTIFLATSLILKKYMYVDSMDNKVLTWKNIFLGAELLYESACLSVCLSVGHTFLKTLYSTTYTDIFIKCKIFQIIKKKNICLNIFQKFFKIYYIKRYESCLFNSFQKLSLFLYKFWFSAISLNICQNIFINKKSFALNIRFFFL